MKTSIPLFPNALRPIGFILFAITTVVVILCLILNINIELEFLTIIDNGNDLLKEKVNLTDELLAIVFIVACFLIGFSKEKIEDEFTTAMRLNALQWSLYINYIILIILALLVHGLDFIPVLMYHPFSILVLFLIRYYYLKLKMRKELRDEK